MSQSKTVLNKFARVALCQLHVTSDKLVNIDHASTIIKSAAAQSEKKVDIFVLPEIWNSPYGTQHFSVYAEPVPKVGEIPSSATSPSAAKLSELAKDLNSWIIGGSIPEYEDCNIDNTIQRKLYNTCIIFDTSGTIVGKHRKMHLFDIDIPGRMTFRESDTLCGGDSVTIVNSPWGPIGVGICYDIRFPELAMLMRQQGCNLLVYPGAFNKVTGPAHWELLLRARAVDNQLYVLGCSPARDETAGYIAYGHSTAVSPWGEVIATTDTAESVIYADLDFNKVDEMRDNIPVSKQKRTDIYELKDSKKMNNNN